MDLAQYLEQIDAVIAHGRYNADWRSLSGHAVPDWYYRGKLGIFIHWGVYSVPAFANEWYPRSMYDKSLREYEHHVSLYGAPDKFGYKDFIPSFRAERFDAGEWVRLFRRAGARFVMPVGEHHDGFAMYDTEFNRWNSVRMGPKRDVIGEIKAACEKEGLEFCVSSHRAEHYFFMNMGRTVASDVTDERYRDFYGPAYHCPELDSFALFPTIADTFSVPPTTEWLEDWLVRTCELVDRYRPKILYFDSWIHNHAFKPYLKKFCAYYYTRAEEWGFDVTINFKHEAFPPTVAVYDVERGALTGISPVPWQTDTAIGRKSWGYTTDNEFKSARQIICDLVDIVSKNGMLLLNVGPKPDGTITDEETAVLLALGEWLDKNGEGIYGATFWRRFGEGEVNNEAGDFMDGNEKAFTQHDFRFTYKEGCIYAFQMRPSGTEICIRSLAFDGGYDYPIEAVIALGNVQIERWERTRGGLNITLREPPEDDLPICFKITIG